MTDDPRPLGFGTRAVHAGTRPAPVTGATMTPVLFTKVYERFGLAFTFVDTTRPAAVEAAFRPETKMLWLESPSNPLLRVSDIAVLAALARGRGALTVVDNTFATPALQRPLALGADVALHST